jgi:hypothetical protein
MYGIVQLRAKVLGQSEQGWRDRYRAHGTEEIVDAPMPGEPGADAVNVFAPGDHRGA